jgi:PhnB protein
MKPQTLTAYPIVDDVPALIGFLTKVFGATEKMRTTGSAGGYHLEALIGDTKLMIGGGGQGVSWKGDTIPMAFHIYVPDVDSTYRLALDSGGESLAAPANQDWGERTANIKDPAGNFWYIATFQGANYFSEGAPTVQPFLQPHRCEPVITFLTAAFGAIELGRAATPDGFILHTTLKIGNSQMELFDAHDNADTAYGRALDAGAVSITPLAHQSFGDRMGGVKDMDGNIWYIASPLSK